MVATNTYRWNRHDLTSAAVAGTLTYDDLWDAILTIDEVGFECIPHSVGMHWIHDHHAMFTKAVGNVTFFVLRTAEEALNADDGNDRARLGYWFIRSFLCSRELFGQLGTEERDRLTIELYGRFGADNEYWSRIATEYGSSKEVIGQAIVARHEHEEQKFGIATDLHDFLKYGLELGQGRDPKGGDVNHLGNWSLNPDCLWAKMSQVHLHQALTICAIKHPGGVLGWQVWMGMRLAFGEEKTAQIVKDAASRLTSIGEASPAVLATLPLVDQKALGKQIKLDEFMSQELKEKTFEFLLALRDPTAVMSVKDLILTTKDKLGIDLIYRMIRRKHKLGTPIEKMAQELLIEAGWGGGLIQRGTYQKNERTYKETQFFVEWKGVKCIQSRDNHRYFPKEGDLVIFRTEGSAARFLTPTVAAVFFVHVTGI